MNNKKSKTLMVLGLGLIFIAGLLMWNNGSDLETISNNQGNTIEESVRNNNDEEEWEQTKNPIDNEDVLIIGDVPEGIIAKETEIIYQGDPPPLSIMLVTPEVADKYWMVGSSGNSDFYAINGSVQDKMAFTDTYSKSNGNDKDIVYVIVQYQDLDEPVGSIRRIRERLVGYEPPMDSSGRWFCVSSALVAPKDSKWIDPDAVDPRSEQTEEFIKALAGEE